MFAGRCTREDARYSSIFASELCAQHEYQQTHTLLLPISVQTTRRRWTQNIVQNSVFSVTTDVFCRITEYRGLWKKSRVINLKFQIFSSLDSPLEGPGLVNEIPRLYSDTPHSVGPLRTSDRPEAETSTWPTTLTKDTQPCLRPESNPQIQKASSRKTTP